MQLLEKVAALTPLLRAERPVAEERYRMSPAVRAALGPTGVFRMLVPREIGGLGVELPELVRVVEELAYGDPSVAWAVVNSSGASGLVGRLSPAAAAEVLEPVDGFYGVGLPPTGRADVVDGGFLVSGRWPVVSGSAEASWFWLNCIVHEEGRPRNAGALAEARFFAVPASAAAVEDTWRGVVAVKGSGSNAVHIDGVVVPEARSASLLGEARSQSRLDVFGALVPFGTVNLETAAVAVGIGRAARDAAIAQAGGRVSVVNRTGWASWPSVQNTVASADMAVEAARRALFAVADACDEEVGAGGRLDATTHARVHSVADHAFRTMRHAVSDLYTVGSVDALRSGHGLEQALRDVHGFSVQWERYRRFQYAAGGALLGLVPDDPTY